MPLKLIRLHNNNFIYFYGIVIAILLWFSATGYPQVYKVIEFGVDQGIPQPYINTINQGNNGYLWIGTGNGLARFDGLNFETFTTNDSLAHDYITCSYKNGDGVWFGHTSGGITFYDGKIFKKIIPASKGKSLITDIVEDAEGNIWVSTQTHGLVLIKDQFEIEPFNMIRDQIPILSFNFLNSNEIIIGSVNGLIYCSLDRRTGQIQIIQPIKGIPESGIQDVIKTRDNAGFYIATQDEGVFRLNREGEDFVVEQIGLGLDIEIEGVQGVYEDSRSNLWISTFGNGLYKLIYSPSEGFKEAINYNENNGLKTNNVKVVYEDIEGNIWIGKYGTGLAKLIEEAFTFYSFDEDKYGNNIYSIYVNDYHEWVGTEKGLIKIDLSRDNEIIFYGIDHGLPLDKISAIYSIDGEDIWVGTEKNGLYRMQADKERFYYYFISGGTLENSINAITGMEDQIWIATEKGICNIDLSTNHIRWFTINQGGLPHNHVNHLFIDSKDRIWISTLSSTLCFIQNNVVEKIEISSKGVLDITSVTEDTNKNIWAGTNGNGIYKIQKDTIINLSSREGLLSDYCYSVIGDKQNHIWVTHRGGLSRVATKDYFIKPLQEEFGINRSTDFNVNATFIDKYGIVWFGSNNGILTYNPSSENQISLAPSLSFTSVIINNEKTDLTEALILAPGRYKIKIEFIGISLKAPGLVKYQYKLEGYDDHWSDLISDNYVSYNGLIDGNYIFQLIAYNGDGTFTQKPLKLNIVIKKPVWKRSWFYIITIIFIVSLIISYIKRREYNLLKEKRILEEKVMERTEEIVRQKEEIEIQRDAIKGQRDLIKAKNRNITDSIRYASNIQSAVFPPLSLLDKLLGNSFIINRPKDIVSGDFYWLTKRNGKIIVTVADCTGHGVPGAFMSMLGITFLNEIVNNSGITQANEILYHLRENVIIALRQTSKEETISDGMDIALCVIDHKKNQLQFSGAFNPLLLIRNKEVQLFKGDYIPIGMSFQKEKVGSFTLHEIDIKKGDIIYMFSDGYADQFGGQNGKKFSGKKFRELLLSIHEKSMYEQKNILEKTMENWMKKTEQIDDITIMGIRL